MKKIQSEKVRMTGDIPSPRFGHSFTLVSKNKAVLFGGAVSVAGKFIITNETFIYDFQTSIWKKFNFGNNFVPSERAAHAATMVGEMQMMVYGGAASGSQGLLKDELYLLDLRREPTWKIIDVQPKNNTPGQRYGHTMVFNKPYLIIFGGNSGNRVENDVWLLNFQVGPFTWTKYEFENSRMPCPRVYHSAALCEEGKATGMMVIYGGRRETKKDHNGSQRQLSVSSLNDIWGLVKHRNGSWDWATPPRTDNYTPIGRYQHLVCFMGSKLVIMGGRASNPEETVNCIEVYDTETAEWQRVNCVSRYRHAIALQNNSKLYVHGGFEPEYISQPLDTMISFDLSMFLNNKRQSLIQAPQQQQPPIQNENKKIQFSNSNSQGSLLQRTRETEEKTAAIKRDSLGLREIGDSQRNVSNNSRIKSALDRSKVQERDLTPSRIINSSKNIRLNNQVVVAKGDKNTLQFQKVPVGSLMEESKRLNNQPEQGMNNYDQTLLQLTDNILMMLMPKNGSSKFNGTNIFPLKKDKIYRLCQETSRILANQSSLIGVRSPVKIFGSLYGRHSDLLRFFESFEYPNESQMETFEYIFLGNYVDKGFNSLETLCLLMALKIKYPEHIHLLRGRHEDPIVNKICGFGEECSMRLGENINEPQSVFQVVNNMFNLLPLAAAIQDKFLCVSGGVGEIESLIDIKNVERPIKVRESQIVTDLLWSDIGGDPKLGYHCKKNEEEELENFLQANNLDMLINTKDGITQGFQMNRCSLSIFSVPNYGKRNNKGGILRINKNLEVVPHILKSSLSTGKSVWVGEPQMKSNMCFSETENEVRREMFNVVV